MANYSFNQAIPFEATRVGDLIKDELVARNMKQSELSRLTGIQRSILNDIIKGKRSLTYEMALLLEKVLDIPASFLLNIQMQYELDNAKRSERVVLQNKRLEIWNILKGQINVSFFRKVGVIKDNVVEDVARIFEVFVVSGLDEFFGLKAKEMGKWYYYRKSEKLTTDSIDILSWKYYCYHLSRKDESLLGNFDKNTVGNLIKELNAVFKENYQTIKRTGRVLNKYGIRFMVVKKIGKVPVDGMSFWEGDNPTIVVTNRIPTIDNFAFTVLHEIGHVCKHLVKNGEAMIQILDEKKGVEEAEADNFALNAVLPDIVWKKFMLETRDVAPYKIAPYIKEEADKFAVNPQILFGRYKHDTDTYRIKNSFETKIR